MFNKTPRTYAVYIEFIQSGRTTCHVIKREDAGEAWRFMYDTITKNNDNGLVQIVDVKRID